MYTISTNYDLKWQLKIATHYQFTKDGKCVNTQRGKEVKRVLNGRSVGFCIQGKFYTLAFLRKQLELIPTYNLPF